MHDQGDTMTEYNYEGHDSSGNAVTARAQFEGTPPEKLYVENTQGGTAWVSLVIDEPAPSAVLAPTAEDVAYEAWRENYARGDEYERNPTIFPGDAFDGGWLAGRKNLIRSLRDADIAPSHVIDWLKKHKH